jgi:thymidylate synthase
MKIKLNNSQNIRECLRDAGCPDMLCKDCAEHYDNRQYRKMISELQVYRKDLRKRLQQTQLEIDILDYLIIEIRTDEKTGTNQ